MPAPLGIRAPAPHSEDEVCVNFKQVSAVTAAHNNPKVFA